MGPVAEEILALMMSLRRIAQVAIVGFLLLLVWTMARRGGRKGLEVAVLLVIGAGAAFFAAVFGPRPPLGEGSAIALAVLAAVLLVAAIGVLLWYGLRPRLRRKTPPKAGGHTHAPWENGGW